MILRRTIAYMIDFFLASLVVGNALALLGGALTSISPRLGGSLLFLLSLPFFLGGLAAVIAAPTARWGTTPGKFLFRLEVVGAHALPPTFRQAFSRELIKLLSLLMPFGLFLALAITVRNGGIALHDQATRTEVVPKVRLTPTQKRWLQAQRRYRR